MCMHSWSEHEMELTDVVEIPAKIHRCALQSHVSGCFDNIYPGKHCKLKWSQSYWESRGETNKKKTKPYILKWAFFSLTNIKL